MNPDVSCHYIGTDMSLDTGAAWSNNPIRQGASTSRSRPFQAPHKKKKQTPTPGPLASTLQMNTRAKGRLNTFTDGGAKKLNRLLMQLLL